VAFFIVFTNLLLVVAWKIPARRSLARAFRHDPCST